MTGSETPARRRFGHRLARLFWGTGGLLDTGISARTAVLAFASTTALFFVTNSYLIDGVRSAYQTVRLTELNGATDAADAVDRLARGGYLDPQIRNWVKDQLNDRPGRRAAREQVLDLLDGVVSDNREDVKRRRAELIEDVSTGKMSGWSSRFFWVETRQPVATDLFDQLADADGKALRSSLDRGDNPEEKKKFLIGFLNSFLAQMQPSLREVDRFNGGVKWLAVFAAWLLLWALAKRFYLLLRVQAHWLGEHPAADRGRLGRFGYWLAARLPALAESEHAELMAIRDRVTGSLTKLEDAALVHDQVGNLVEAVESRVYATYSYCVGLLPSLGFIGTVWGLGGALLQANGLFSLADRQKTIGYITHELGIAFDTTLIALGASVLTGVGVAALRLRERRLLAGVEQVLLAQKQVSAVRVARLANKADAATVELTPAGPFGGEVRA